MGATSGPLLHGPAGMAPPGVLALGPMASHRASVSTATWVGEQGGGPTGLGSPLSTLTLCLFPSQPQQMNQFPVGGQPSSSLQDPPQLYSPASQPQFQLPSGTQQVLGAWRGPGLRGRYLWLGLAKDLTLPQLTHLEHGDNILHHTRVMGSFIQFLPKKPAVGKDKIASWGYKPHTSSHFSRLGWVGVGLL